jgi:hypothetical protein
VYGYKGIRDYGYRDKMAQAYVYLQDEFMIRNI